MRKLLFSAVASMVMILIGSGIIARAQDTTSNHGMSVTGPAADRKPVENLQKRKDQQAPHGSESPPASSSGSSKEETPGLNSATSNSH
jgi:hypothetical protein